MEVRFTDQETQAWEGGAHHPLGPRPGAPLAASTWPLTQVLVPEPAGLKGGSGCQPLPARLRLGRWRDWRLPAEKPLPPLPLLPFPGPPRPQAPLPSTGRFQLLLSFVHSPLQGATLRWET